MKLIDEDVWWMMKYNYGAQIDSVLSGLIITVVITLWLGPGIWLLHIDRPINALVWLIGTLLVSWISYMYFTAKARCIEKAREALERGSRNGY